jgi:hypothetical protein
VEVPADLKRVNFSLNWSDPDSAVYFLLTDPNQKEYFDPQTPQNGLCRMDPTHQTCIIENPTPGAWQVGVIPIKVTEGNEWVFWASAKTAITFQLFVGTPEPQQTTGSPIHILAFLGEGEKPIGDGSVKVRVYGPHGASWPALELYDDGAHGDGAAKDGIYANYFTGGAMAGGYSVRGVAEGNDQLGKAFSLLDQTGFHLRPRAAYIYDQDGGTAESYKKLLEANGVGVDLLHMDQVRRTELLPYSLMIVGPDTGKLDKWGTQEVVEHIIKYQRPVLGLGEGGYAFFGRLQRNIGHPNGAHGTGNKVIRESLGDRFWHQPYEFEVEKERIWQLYTENSGRVEIFLGEKPSGLTVFGYNDTNTLYADLVMESGFYMLWGFQLGPDSMTDDGRNLFVNVVYRTMN